MKLEDRDIREAVMVFREGVKKPCPDDESLAAFIEQKLPELQRAEIGAHILECDRCGDSVGAASGEIPNKIRVPLEAIRKATAAIPANPSAWEIVVRFAADRVEALKNTGGRTRYFSPAYATARSASSSDGSLVSCSANIGGIDVEVEIEHLGRGLGEVKVILKERGIVPKPSLRATLKSGNKELASYVAAEGSALFEKLPVGDYNLIISRRGVSLGEIALSMKGE